MWALLGLQVIVRRGARLPAITKLLADENGEVRLRAVMAMAAVGQAEHRHKIFVRAGSCKRPPRSASRRIGSLRPGLAASPSTRYPEGLVPAWNFDLSPGLHLPVDLRLDLGAVGELQLERPRVDGYAFAK